MIPYTIRKIIEVFNTPLMFVLTTLTLLIILFSAFAGYSMHAVNILNNPLPVNYGEGTLLNLCVELAEKGNYYWDIHEYPFIHGAYPPVFMLASSPLIKMFGPRFITGRILSILATILIALIIYRKVRGYSQNSLLAVIFGLFVFTPNFVYEFSPLMRVDMPAILFSLLGLYFYFRYKPKNSPARFLCHIFFILGFYTKQNALAAPLALFAWLALVERDWKEMFLNLSLYLAPLLGIFLIYNQSTDGEFYRHTIPYMEFYEINYSFSLACYWSFIKRTWLLLILSAVSLFQFRRLNIYTFYFLFAFIFLVTIGKAGAYINYFIEPFLALLILSAFSAHDFSGFIKRNAFFTLLNVILIVTALQLMPSFNKYQDAWERITDAKYGIMQEKQLEATRYLLNLFEGEVIAEEMGHLLISGKEVIFEPFQFQQMAEQGLWDPSVLIQDCFEEKFPIILSGRIIESMPGMTDCIKKHYFELRPHSKIYVLKKYKEKICTDPYLKNLKICR